MDYVVLDLVDALVDRVRFANASESLSKFAHLKAEAFERAFGLSRSSQPSAKIDRRLVYVLTAVIETLATLRSPFEGILEGKVPLPDFDAHRSRIEANVYALRETCRLAAEAVLIQMHPSLLGEKRTSAELMEVGFDDRQAISADDFA